MTAAVAGVHTGGCWHCGEPLPAAPVMATVADTARAMCCQGCKAAAEWIDQLGLGDYYRLRSEPALTPAQTPARHDAWARPELARHAQRELGDGQVETCVLIEGVRCSACVWLIERGLSGDAGIARVQVNAAARRARLVFDPARTDLPRILERLERIGYRALPLDAAALDDARKRESRAALKRLVVAGFGAMQAMMYASAIYLGAFAAMDETTRDFFRWLGLLVATPVVFYSARPFFAGARRNLAARRLGVDVPVALAIGLIYLASVVEAFRGGVEVYFDSVSMFVFFLLIGRYLEMRARHRASDLGDALARMTPLFADRIRSDGSLERVGASELVPGDRVHVAEGASVPADGILASARCRVDEALLSGESEPITRRRGEELVAGSLLVEGPAELRVERVGGETILAGILALVTRAASERPRLAEVGERAAARFVARILVLAVLTAIGWSLVDPSRAFSAVLAVLVVSCPCAFALAVPAALTRAMAVLARRGVLVTRADAIEQLAGMDHAVFDKTGTLTEAELGLEQVQPLGALSGSEALQRAAALARGSRHPASRAIAEAAADHAIPPADEVRAIAGGGMEGVVDGCRLRLGHAAFALETADFDPALDDAVVLAADGTPLAAFRLSERLRPGARGALAALREDGVEVEIASGDARAKVAAVAAAVGVDTWHARMAPADKLARLQSLRGEGKRVAAIGDGINDAPVLAGADVAISLASGAELAQASSDVILAGERLGALAEARQLSREAMRILRQNQRWALGYNLSVVPLGALGFIPPWLAAIGMSLSSLGVVLNALRIGREAEHAQPGQPGGQPAEAAP